MIIIGIDNGVTGSFALLKEDGVFIDYFATPVNRELNYTKTKAYINRLDFKKLRKYFVEYCNEDTFCFIERPMVNPMRWKASISAVRCLEATLLLLEEFGLPFEYIDSKEWQKNLLPKGKSDSKDLKKQSDLICKRLFPSVKIKKSGDGDSLLIAEYGRKKRLGVL